LWAFIELLAPTGLEDEVGSRRRDKEFVDQDWHSHRFIIRQTAKNTISPQIGEITP
jgi:hypothetical protein